MLGNAQEQAAMVAALVLCTQGDPVPLMVMRAVQTTMLPVVVAAALAQTALLLVTVMVALVALAHLTLSMTEQLAITVVAEGAKE
jgi:hypothetical protein